MVTIGMNYKVLLGKGETFEKAFANVIRVMQDIEAHGETRLFRDVLDEDHYLIISDWTSEDAFNAFIESDQFAKVVTWGKENILVGRPKHTIYRHDQA